MTTVHVILLLYYITYTYTCIYIHIHIYTVQKCIYSLNLDLMNYNSNSHQLT